MELEKKIYITEHKARGSDRKLYRISTYSEFSFRSGVQADISLFSEDLERFGIDPSEDLAGKVLQLSLEAVEVPEEGTYPHSPDDVYIIDLQKIESSIPPPGASYLKGAEEGYISYTVTLVTNHPLMSVWVEPSYIFKLHISKEEHDKLLSIVPGMMRVKLSLEE